ncbi:kinase-like protein [Gigaspora margarita]|uniref:Kinase-like protein n=1 Tax=Gigaspora margarita TaxID=4874 RepID=A0A8H4AK79_GIGMA|nr:kinase-like protein [Gigaspora margarita]
MILKRVESSINDKPIKILEYSSFVNSNIILASETNLVYRVDLRDGNTVALKTFKSDVSHYYEDPFDGFIREVKINNMIAYHENIIKFLGITKDPKDKYFMVHEFASNGDLQSYLNTHHNLDWLTKVNMAKDISNGIEHLHNAIIVHRDLHDRNILVHSDGRLVIADFGISKRLGDDTVSISAGRYAYLAPECLQDHNFKRGKPCDIYSLGMLFWEISSGISPLNGKEKIEIYQCVVDRGERELPIDGTPSDYISLYRNARNGDSELRPGIAAIQRILDKVIERLLKLSEHQSALSGLNVSELKTRGESYFNEEKFDEALIYLNKSLEINPNDALTSFRCGEANRRINYLEKSLENYNIVELHIS